MSLHSTLVSYLEKLLWLLTGNFAVPGGQYIPTSIVNLAGSGHERPRARTAQPGRRRPDHLRPGAVQRDRRGDPHRPPGPLPGDARRERQPGPLARRQPADARGAGGARARRRDRRVDDRDRPAGRLRAAGRVAVREVRGDVLQLRVPRERVPPPPPAPRAAAGHAGRAGDPRPAVRGARRRHRGRPRAASRAAAAGPGRRSPRRSSPPTTARPELGRLAPVLLYRTLGPTLPADAAAAAVLWPAAHQARSASRSRSRGRVRHRAGGRRGAVRRHPRRRPGSCSPRTSRRRRGAGCAPTTASCTSPSTRCWPSSPSCRPRAARDVIPSIPFVLSAGERRSFTANTIMRDPTWRKRDADGALRIGPADAARTRRRRRRCVRITTQRGSAVAAAEVDEAMQPGHVSLPNGLGLDYPRGRRRSRHRRGAERADRPATTATRSPARRSTSTCRPGWRASCRPLRPVVAWARCGAPASTTGRARSPGSRTWWATGGRRS